MLFLVIIVILIIIVCFTAKKEHYHNTEIVEQDFGDYVEDHNDNPKGCLDNRPCAYEAQRGHVESCPKGAKSVKEFHKDFFNFRDKTTNNTSMVLDSVDKINDMQLNGSMWNMTDGAKISDIYDNLTKYPKPQERYTRIPTFTDTIQDNYTTDQFIGLYGQGNEWTYPRENENNGGEVDTNLFASDTAFSGFMPLSVFPPTKQIEYLDK